MRATELLYEGRSMPCIVVDVQPEYSGINDGNEDPVFEEIIQFVNNQTGSVLMFVNADKDGLTSDTIPHIKQYWEDSGFDPTNWNRVTFNDKGYGYLRSWMDHPIPPATIIKTIRLLYQQKKRDTEQLVFPENVKDHTPDMTEIMNAIYEMDDDLLSVKWTSIAQLKRFNGSYIMGGGRNECLREIELLMNAFNIKYKRIDSLVYG